MALEKGGNSRREGASRVVCRTAPLLSLAAAPLESRRTQDDGAWEV